MPVSRRGFALGMGIVNGCMGIRMPPTSYAISEENLLFLEAWRAVDRAYVDKTFNGQTWFRYREKVLKKASMEDRDETYDVIRGGKVHRAGAAGRLEMLATLDSECVLKVLSFATSQIVEFRLIRAAISLNPVSSLLCPTPDESAASGVGLIKLSTFNSNSAGKVREAIKELQGEGMKVLVLDVRNNGGGLFPAGVEIARMLMRAGVIVQIADQDGVRDIYEADNSAFAYSALLGGTAGALTGVGIEVGFQDKMVGKEKKTELVVVAPAQGGPAEAAGITSGDVLLEIGGKSTAGMGLYDAAQLLQGPSGRCARALEGTLSSLSALKAVTAWLEQCAVTGASGSGLDLKVVMVVNKGTASASEVLAGALSDNNRATIVGELTFGKGLIQTIVPLSDGSAVVITVARYQTPSGTDINKIGIKPEIDLPVSTYPSNTTGLCKTLVNLDIAPKLFGTALDASITG
eukprot:gene1447-2068_t